MAQHAAKSSDKRFMNISLAEYNVIRARELNRQAARAAGKKPQEFQSLSIIIPGQVRGGKNNMIVTRTGLHFPKPEWAKWRNAMVAVVRSQLPTDWQPIDAPCLVKLTYIAGDKRRRDQPAIIDAIFHVLEKAGVVTDDTLMWINDSTRGYDKARPYCSVQITKEEK